MCLNFVFRSIYFGTAHVKVDIEEIPKQNRNELDAAWAFLIARKMI